VGRVRAPGGGPKRANEPLRSRSACSRAIVPESLHDAFVARLIEATRSLKLAPAEDPGSTVGPVIDADAHQRILGTIEKSKAEGRLVYAGEVGVLQGEGYYIAPHIFDAVPPTTSLAQEEIFGPVLAVVLACLCTGCDSLRPPTGTITRQSPSRHYDEDPGIMDAIGWLAGPLIWAGAQALANH